MGTYCGKKEFEEILPFLRVRKSYYWSAIVNSVYGVEHVLDEIFGKENNTFANRVLNQNLSRSRDIYQEEDIIYLRNIIRRSNR